MGRIDRKRDGTVSDEGETNPTSLPGCQSLGPGTSAVKSKWGRWHSDHPEIYGSLVCEYD